MFFHVSPITTLLSFTFNAMNGLFKNPNFHPLENAELIHENHYTCEFRWDENDEVVTNVVLKKDGLCWRSMVSRIPKSQKSNQKM